MPLPALQLNEHFDLIKCSFLSAGELVLFSPYSRQSLLCDAAVLPYLQQLRQNPAASLTAWQAIRGNAQEKQQLCDTLVEMEILQPLTD